MQTRAELTQGNQWAIFPIKQYTEIGYKKASANRGQLLQQCGEAIRAKRANEQKLLTEKKRNSNQNSKTEISNKGIREVKKRGLGRADWKEKCLQKLRD